MNASSWSTRYAALKHQQRRERDANRGPQPCLHCPQTQVPGCVFCEAHNAEHQAALARGDFETCIRMTSSRTCWP